MPLTVLVALLVGVVLAVAVTIAVPRGLSGLGHTNTSESKGEDRSEKRHDHLTLVHRCPYLLARSGS
jgi:hypothetical protein